MNNDASRTRRATSARGAAAAAALLTAQAFALLAPDASAQQPDIGFPPVTLDRSSYVFDTAEQHRVRVDVVVRGLAHPFSVAFLPNGDALISERGGALRLVRGATSANARLEPDAVAGAPAPSAVRGGGLHDVVLHPSFDDNRLVYFSYNKVGTPEGSGPGSAPMSIAVGRARFDAGRLADAEEIFVGGERDGGSGSRLAFAPDGTLYVTTGAPFDEAAQSPDNVYGKILRLDEDGGVPDDNPFVGEDGARPEVFTLGHRDQLGLTVAPNGALLAAEHGPNGGDEVNLIRAGGNYGWPTYSYGRTYEGPRHSKMPIAEGIEQPLILWVPSIAPTGMTFYTGDRIPAWRGNLFVGSARRGEIPGTGGLERIVLNEALEELRRETLLTGLRQRIRDVRQGPDGLLYVITDEDDGALLRIAPTD
ncbi:MAG: PQQ-dependent sugar dehydrogenase [Gammaproteobacteria bacterium]|nr:PQQ-dependent sugar dehydrogenase [Gammaproteobacteria bacterium]